MAEKKPAKAKKSKAKPKAKKKEKAAPKAKKAKPAPAPEPKPEAPKRVEIVDAHGDKHEGMVFGFMEIWRLKKEGKRLGRKYFWDEDHYRFRKLKVDHNGRVFTDPDGTQHTQVVVEAIVDDGFKKMHAKLYRKFLEEFGEREDTRYKK